MPKNKNIKKQKAPLKVEIEAMLKEAMATNKQLMERLLKLETHPQNLDTKVDKEEKELRSDDFITVVSLCNFKLNLSTEGFGKGRKYAFRKFGEKKRISYRDLISIIETNMSFLEAGYFYILDSRVIEKHGFEEMYENILSREKFEEALACNQETSIELYKVANERQRKMIDRTLVHKIVEGENIDLNVVSLISNIGSTDIRKTAEDAKATRELMNN